MAWLRPPKESSLFFRGSYFADESANKLAAASIPSQQSSRDDQRSAIQRVDSGEMNDVLAQIFHGDSGEEEDDDDKEVSFSQQSYSEDIPVPKQPVKQSTNGFDIDAALTWIAINKINGTLHSLCDWTQPNIIRRSIDRDAFAKWLAEWQCREFPKQFTNLQSTYLVAARAISDETWTQTLLPKLCQIVTATSK